MYNDVLKRHNPKIKTEWSDTRDTSQLFGILIKCISSSYDPEIQVLELRTSKDYCLVCKLDMNILRLTVRINSECPSKQYKWLCNIFHCI